MHDARAEVARVPDPGSRTAYPAVRVHLVNGVLWIVAGGPLLMRGLVEQVQEAPPMNARHARSCARLGAGAVAVLALSWASGASAATECVPTTDSPTLDVEAGPVEPGAVLRVTGAGWCHPADGGSRVAIQIDEGTYSRPGDQLDSDRTVWAVVDADGADGTFVYDLQLPDGTPQTSEPVLGEGPHTLRAVSGALKEGDTDRAVTSGEFVVRPYAPSGAPGPVDASSLTPEGERAVSATLASSRLVVRVAGGQEGDWVFLSLLADGTQSQPWGSTWHRLDTQGGVEVSLGEEPTRGAQRLVVQSGNRDRVGEVLGWTTVDLGASEPEPAPTREPTEKPAGKPAKEPGRKPPQKAGDRPAEKPAEKPATPPGTRTVVVPASRTTPWPITALPRATEPSARPTPRRSPKDEVDDEEPTPTEPVGPESPVGRWSGFWAKDELAAEVRRDELVVDAGASSVVHVHVHDLTSAVAAGWVAGDSDGRIRLDIGDLPPGSYRFALQQRGQEYLGWAALEVPEEGRPTTTGDRGGLGGLARGAGDDDGSANGWLAGLGLMLLAGVGLGTSATRRKVTR